MKLHTDKVRTLSGAALLLMLACASTPVLAVETDRITVEDPATNAIKFKVTSEGNVTASSFIGDGASLANVPHWKGTWSAATTYAKDDCVAAGGSSWIAIAASTNAVPASSPASWAVLAAQGPAGAAGSPGTAGAAGPQGPQGPQGPTGSSDTQSQILTKIGTPTNGAVISIQQGPTEAAKTVKFAIQDNTGSQNAMLSANGRLAIGSNIQPSDLNPAVYAKGLNSYSSQIMTHYNGTTPNGGGGYLVYHSNSNGALPLTNDRLGYFLFGSYDGTTPRNAAGLVSRTESDWTSSSTPAFFAFETTAPGFVSRSEKFRVTGSGNVGIGTTTPSQKLEVNGGVRLNAATANPACDSTTRGTIWFVQGGVNVKDVVEVCAKDAANAYAWRTLY